MNEQFSTLATEQASFSGITAANQKVLLPFGIEHMVEIEYDSMGAISSGAGVTFTYTNTVIDDEGGSGD